LGWLLLPKVLIWSFDIFLIVFGVLTLKKTEIIVNLNLLLWVVVITTPLLGEILIRTGIALNVDQFKSPSLYADSKVDDDYWKLSLEWEKNRRNLFIKTGGQLSTKPERVHPLLGWSQTNITKDNPLGLQEDTLKKMGSMRPKILFYGDSFVKGVSDKEFQIPRFMNSKMGGVDVVDLGEGAYGTDQVYLMFQETYQKVSHPLVLVGLLPGDLDRLVLSVRPAQKPYFIIDAAGNLQLKGVPIEIDQRKYFQNHPVSIKSYFLAFLKQKFFFAEQKIGMKEQIASRLLELFKSNAVNANDKLLFILFYEESALKRIDWREAFLKNKLNQMGMPYIDTKDILLRYAQENHLDPSSFYKKGNGHHNNLGNQVIAQGIIRYLEMNHYIPLKNGQEAPGMKLF